MAPVVAPRAALTRARNASIGTPTSCGEALATPSSRWSSRPRRGRAAAPPAARRSRPSARSRRSARRSRSRATPRGQALGCPWASARGPRNPPPGVPRSPWSVAIVAPRFGVVRAHVRAPPGRSQQDGDLEHIAPQHRDPPVVRRGPRGPFFLPEDRHFKKTADQITMPRKFPLEKTRNIGIMAHIDAGKTTTTERILYYTGRTYKIGEVTRAPRRWTGWSRSRSAASRSRRLPPPPSGPTIASTSSTRPATWTSRSEVERSLRVLDGAIALFDSVAGVEPQSETVWRQADKYSVPRIAYITRWTASGRTSTRASRRWSTAWARTRCRSSCRSGPRATSLGIIDLVAMEADHLPGRPGQGRHPRRDPGAPRRRGRRRARAPARGGLHYDDELVELILEEQEVPTDLLKRAIRKATLEIKLTPSCVARPSRTRACSRCSTRSSTTCRARSTCPPSRATWSTARARRARSPSAPPATRSRLSALAFKIMADPFVGKLATSASTPAAVGGRADPQRDDHEDRARRPHPDDARQRPRGGRRGLLRRHRAGVGLKQIVTRDTLCAPDAALRLENITFPEPVIKVAVEPKTKSDQEKMSVALGRLAEEDPTFQVQTNEDSARPRSPAWASCTSRSSSTA